MKAVLFDLDDTLYPERLFVDSGFRAVADVLAARTGAPAAVLFDRMQAILDAEGRGRVFDTILDEAMPGAWTPDDVRTLLFVYRSHRPRLAPFDEALPTLALLRQAGCRLGIVTDGAGTVQRNKVAALGLEPHVDVVVCSDEIGREWWKPSTAPFRVALSLLGVPPAQATYVGNDPAKDFAGPRALGMQTIQIGDWGRGAELAEPLRPAHFITTLAEVPALVGCAPLAR